MRQRDEKGFTLIEVVVVVAVIAILAAVLTPYITKYIDDSKIAKARNEAQVIAAAVTNAYKDLGRWPNRNTAVADYGGLYTGAVTPTSAFINSAAGWAVAGALWSPLDNQLVTNGPGYPTTGDTKWAGPYATTLPVDPWGGRTSSTPRTSRRWLCRPSRSGSSPRGRTASSRPTSPPPRP